MNTVNSKINQLRVEIEELETAILDLSNKESDLLTAIENVMDSKMEAMRVRLANIAALTQLETEKFGKC